MTMAFILGNKKEIILREQNIEASKQIEQKYNLSSVCANVLAARGFKDDEQLKTFLYPTFKEGLPSPNGMLGLNEAAKIILDAILKNQIIAICSDFDVDGLTSSSQLQNLFSSLNVKSVIYVPDRFKEGYGLNNRMIDEAHLSGASLLLSLDYGTTNKEQVKYAKSLGMKVVVVDHHHVGTNDPEADAFVNPKQQGCKFQEYELCTAGLVWYLIIVLRNMLIQNGFKDVKDPKEFLDLASIGTICDMVPLKGPNRVIAKKGLEFLAETKRVGIQALKNSIGLQKNITSYDVSFNIGPRLNAAGRMLTGEIVSELLTTNDEKRAKKIAEKLEKLNSKRQSVEEQIKKEAIKQVEKLDYIPYGICVYHPDFHTGVIGIVAQRLVEIYYKPSIVLGLDEDGIYKGSVRGIEGFSVIECLESLAPYLEKFGGHTMAGGLSVKREMVKVLAEKFNLYCKKKFHDKEVNCKVYADTQVNISELNKKVVDELNIFSPNGSSNPSPLLLCKNLEVKKIYIIKNAHLKVVFSDESNRILTGMLWRQIDNPLLKEGKHVDVVFKPSVSTYYGIEEIQATICAVDNAA